MLLHPIFLLSVLLNFNPSLSYTLRNCSIEYSEYVWEVSVICNNRGLASVPDDIPENATSLNLNFNQIVTVNRTYFSGLLKLLDLALEFNSVSHINDRAFEDLVCLRNLSLSTNSLTMLSDDVFKGLSKLENLSLDKNQLQYISPKAFQPLNSLKKVILAYNKLQEISDIVGILQLPNIYELHAGLNRFTSFDTDDMPFNKSNLRILWFNGNPLKNFRITRDVFGFLESLDMSKCSPGFEWYVVDKNYLRSLKILYLSGTEVSFKMHKRIFQSTFALEYVWPSYITEWLENGLLNFICQMPSLARLDLSMNDIYNLNDTLLQPCSKITELALNSNVMTSLSENSLRPLNQLQYLSLSYNFLTTVPTAVRGLSKLISLGLRSNDIGELRCGDFLNLTSLLRLTLDKNRISVVRGCAFQDLSELTYLNLDSNPIIRLGDTFRVSLRKLYILKMSMNQIVEFDEGDFKGLPSLLVLYIQSGMVCREKNGTFYGLHNLTTLVLAAYSLDKDIFRGMPNLQNLTMYLPILENNLSYEVNNDPPFLFLPFLKILSIYNSNEWTVVISPNLLCGLQYLEQFASENFFTGTPHPDTFTYTPRLKSLRITHSYILNPKPELLQPLTNLQALDLSNNKLRSLDFLIKANLSSLRWLKLTENEFTVVDETVLQSLPALTYLDLSGNPFTCNCLNSGFIQWVKSTNQTQVVNAYQYDCYFPPSKQGTKLMDFDVKSCWMDVGFLCYISSSSLVMLTLLTSFIYHFLRWQIVYAFLLFQAFLYDKRKGRKGAPHLYDAFISYNVEDEAWVYREMLPVLEGEQGWRLCLHHRDFQPGIPIMENIIDAIYSSRKTICVISRSYLQSEWCSKEFQMASFRLFDEKKDVLILLFLEEIPDQQLSPYYRMRKLVKKRTYLSWPKAGQHTGVFWQNVQRALQTGDAPTDGRDILTAGLAPDK
ncbi:toll-like receptor 13 isoform X2 [Cheilinus undulatus]|nr:toll-like receptor 13 isoform X2 [Cheilinus undulatus]